MGSIAPYPMPSTAFHPVGPNLSPLLGGCESLEVTSLLQSQVFGLFVFYCKLSLGIPALYQIIYSKVSETVSGDSMAQLLVVLLLRVPD